MENQRNANAESEIHSNNDRIPTEGHIHTIYIDKDNITQG